MNLITTHNGPGTHGLPRLTTTVPKEYVHRTGLAEVFLTSCTAQGPLTYTLTGQWPRAHPYFTTPDGRAHDPIQVAETLRQAGMLLAHTHLDVPLGHHFILWSLSHTTTHPHALDIGPTPTDFTIHAHCTHLTQRRHTINRATLHMTIHRNNTPIAHGTATFSTTTPTTYTRLRHTTATPNTDGTDGMSSTNGTDGTSGTGGMSSTDGPGGASDTSGTGGVSGTAGTGGVSDTGGTGGVSGTGGPGGVSDTSGTASTGGLSGTGGTDGITNTGGTTSTGSTTGTSGPAATTAAAPATPHPQPMPPTTVGRLTPNDVVLTPTDHPHHWLLTPNLNHPTLFDHTGDHIPGMVLLEAARQATYNATHNTNDTNTPHHTPTTTSTTTTFHRYTELHQPSHIHITRITPDNNTTTTIEITGTQNNQTTFTTTTTITHQHPPTNN